MHQAAARRSVCARAWTETTVAVDQLINTGESAKAHARLGQFTRRYGSDDETRALKERIGPLPQPARPKSTAPESGALARDVVSARSLIDQAERTDLHLSKKHNSENKIPIINK